MRLDRAWAGEELVRMGLARDAAASVRGSRGETYQVSLERSSCTCKDHIYRKRTCKHLRLLAAQSRRAHGEKGTAESSAVQSSSTGALSDASTVNSAASSPSGGASSGRP